MIPGASTRKKNSSLHGSGRVGSSAGAGANIFWTVDPTREFFLKLADPTRPVSFFINHLARPVGEINDPSRAPEKKAMHRYVCINIYVVQLNVQWVSSLPVSRFSRCKNFLGLGWGRVHALLRMHCSRVQLSRRRVHALTAVTGRSCGCDSDRVGNFSE